MNRRRMRKRLLFGTIFLALVVIALVGWTAQAVRAAAAGPRLAPAR